MKKENLARGVSTQYPILHARLKPTIEQNTTKRLSPNFAFNIKGKPSRPRQFLVTERPLKMMQNDANILLWKVFCSHGI